MVQEQYFAICRKHWIVPVSRGVIALIILVWLFQWEGNALYNIVHFGVPILLLISGIVEYNTNYIAVTNVKIIVHMGFLKTTDYATPLNKIQAISLSSGIFGKLFGYHKITIDHAGTGRSEYQFNHMADAQDFVNVLERLAGMR